MTIQEINKEIEKKFNKIGIHHINMIAVGNSISSGYSMVHTIKPLLNYNETLKDDIKGLETYHFARAQDNCDAHIYRWLEGNYSLSDIYQMNRRDYELMPLAVDRDGKKIGLTTEMRDEYYPLHPKNDPQFKDLITPQKDTANIIIYNGGTGSFLDNVTRSGCHKLTYGIKKDMGAIDSFMQEVAILNEQYSKNPPTQVYLCGAPRYALPVEQFINTKLRTITNRHPASTYVRPPICSNVQKCDNGNLGVDFHYSKQGYLDLNYRIINSILDNYVVNRSVITTASKLRKANEQMFYYINTNLNSFEAKSARENAFDDIILEQFDILEDLEEDTNLYVNKMKQEIKENRAYEYYTLVKKINPLQRLDAIAKSR